MKKLDSENIKSIIKFMMADKEIDSFKELAEKIGEKSEVTFRAKLNRGNIRLVDFINVADYLGYEVSVKRKEEN